MALRCAKAKTGVINRQTREREINLETLVFIVRLFKRCALFFINFYATPACSIPLEIMNCLTGLRSRYYVAIVRVKQVIFVTLLRIEKKCTNVIPSLFSSKGTSSYAEKNNCYLCVHCNGHGQCLCAKSE